MSGTDSYMGTSQSVGPLLTWVRLQLPLGEGGDGGGYLTSLSLLPYPPQGACGVFYGRMLPPPLGSCCSLEGRFLPEAGSEAPRVSHSWYVSLKWCHSRNEVPAVMFLLAAHLTWFIL